MTVPPGSTIGILGGGQLGRMLAIAAANLGYRTHVYAPGMSGPASEVAARWTRGAYDDAAAVAAFATQVDVITYEFENVDLAALAGIGGVRPGPQALAVAQDRLAEKSFARGLGGRPAAFRAVDTLDTLRAALDAIGVPAVLKTRRMGYDGKGQVRITDAGQAEWAWQAIAGQPAILEAMVAFDAEFSILLARDTEGAMVRWDAVGNVHADGILATSTVPAEGIVAAQAGEAAALAERIATALDYVGVLTCEFLRRRTAGVQRNRAARP